ncbi:site-2 protease family protein [Metabacillus fastidiosus]|uniref:site-2 protease family protein n=1 Tax=Metabacillus fastidiosus TaxID=1458 RepID=UPI002DB955DD|nr:site-2 protease family protein [Metabacillus fastidiosus]MEC2075975.1 site-2 protease family protein [Metabacillus fastidiosus]
MESFLAFPLEYIPYVIITLMIAFTVHEFAHAYVAYKFGDSTAKDQGRLTLSPLAHLDPFGTILIFIAGFGWAKPVPVNRYYFKNPRLAGILVSIAGPLSNLVIAFIGMAMFAVLVSTNVLGFLPGYMVEGLGQFFTILINLNILLFIFNLLPLPPLDGYRIIQDLVSANTRAKMTQYENYAIVIFLILVITPLDQYTIHPLINNGMEIILTLFNLILSPFIAK